METTNETPTVPTNDSSITITSTTDTPEQMLAAATGEAVEQAAESTDDAAATDKEGEAPATPAAKATDIEDRIARADWERYRALNERDRALERIAELEGRGKKPATEEPAKPTIPAFPEPRPSINDYDTIEEWTQELNDWTDRKAEFREEQRELLRRTESEISKRNSEVSAVTQRHIERVNKFRETHADFDEVAQQAIAAELPMTGIMLQHVQASEFGPAILYELAKNETLCREIAALPAGPALVALGELQAELKQRSKAAPEKKVETAATPTSIQQPRSVPPAPINPGGGGPTVTTKSDDDMSYEEFKAMRRKQGAR